MTGQIAIGAPKGTGAHLIMELGTPPSGTVAHDSLNPTLRIDNIPKPANGQMSGIANGLNQAMAFYIPVQNNHNRDEHTITIRGNAPSSKTTEDIPNFKYDFSNNFVIDGSGPTLTAVDDSVTLYPQVTATGGQVVGNGMFRLQHGSLTLENVTVQKFSSSYGNACMAQVYLHAGSGYVSDSVALYLKFDHCHFNHIGGQSSTGSPVLRMQADSKTTSVGNLNRDAIIQNCLIENTFGSYSLAVGQTTPIDNANGTIRTVGNNKVTLAIKKTHMKHNYGCPVRWHGASTASKLKVDSCLIERNFTCLDNNVKGGGGLLLKGPAEVRNSIIRNNRTQGDGGGIYLSTYTDFGNGTPDLVPEHSVLDLDPGTIISNNVALKNGGGVAIDGIRMINNYISEPQDPNGPNGYIWFAPDSTAFTLKFQLGGAKVINNTALGFDLPNTFYMPSNPKAVGLGGGVFIARNEQTTYFRVECLLDKGEISGNKVKVISNDTIIEGKGGGVAIYTPDSVSNPAETPYRVKPQNVDVIIGVAGGNEEMLIQNDSAAYGGGIYVEAYPLNYNGVTSQVNTTVYDHSNIDNNIAKIDGGGLYVETGTVSILKEGSYSPTFQRNSASTGDGGGVYLNRGNIDMKGATIGGDETAKGNTAGDSGGGIYVNTGTVTMLSSKVSYNQANGTNGDGGGIYVNSGDVLINHKEQSTGTPSQINYNTAKGNGGGIYDWAGKVVVFGSFDGDSTYRVQISHNTATTGMGGGIYCKGDTTSSAYDIRMLRVRLEGNTSGNHGGGIYLEGGKVSIINGWLLSNTANGGGGGIYTNKGDIDINITGEERQPSRINGNMAKLNGGGLNTHSGFITVRGKSKNDRIQIIGNVAGDGGMGSGGGVFCMGSSAEAEYITMTHVDLFNNKAKGYDSTNPTVNNVTMGSGGGIYLQKGVITVTDVAIQGNKAQYNGGGINNHSGNIDVNGCLIGGAEGKGNQAGNSGGGIYTNQGDIDIEDFVETAGNIQRIESKITHNTAAVNGGGADTRMGTIWVNKKEMDDQIEIAFNTAKKGGGLYANSGTIITYNALIHDNTANENGGGLNNHAGDIILHGGILTNNSALEGHGGGAYTFVGDIDLFQFPSTKLDNVTLNEGTKVFNNIAKINGGAFNNHTGRVDVRHATIYNNTATLGNGGGIFCEGPHANDNRGLGYTIRLFCSDMVQNKTLGQDGTAADPTGRGGGIYLKYGNIYAHYSNIRDNEANINGGGIDNHQGNILLYGCEVKGNRAVELDGGGIYTFEGNITTGPSIKRESPLGAKITVIENNSAHRNGGGINNQKGNIDLNGDRIASNQALNGDGGGVYIANGNITLNGGKIELNSATLGNGGGVYSGGGVFDIHEREENPDPIVLIVDAEVKRNADTTSQHATVHYHLVDQGKYSGIVDNSVKHGIIWWKKQHEAEAETVYFGETPSNYVSSQGEPACERITIPSKNDTIPQGIEPDTIYHVKAFFEYQYKNDENVTITKRGYSEEMEFVTYSAKPLVVSGAVSNITSTSAQGSGKIMDPGTSPITARGVKIWRDTIHGESTPPAPLYISSTITTNFFTVDSLRDPANGATQLLPNQKYYACAYATNGSGTSEGNRVEFTTLKNTPYMGTNLVIVTDTIENDSIIVRASFTMPAGTVFGTGANQVQGFGFVWSTDDDPELGYDRTTPGTLQDDSLTFTASYRGARENICAYVRAYATYVESTVTSGSNPANYSLTTPTPHYTPYLNDAPVVRAFRITGITQNSATIHCQIYSGYGDGTTKYGVYLENYDQTVNPANTGSNYSSPYIPHTTNYDNGIYTVTLTGLIPGTTYYLKAYATNEENPTSYDDYSYGNGYNFTALPVVQPVVDIVAIDTITKVSAKVHCSVNNGGATVTDWGVKYSTNSDMTNATDVNKPGGGNQLSSNTFTVNLDNEGHNLLTEHTTYYVQAYATNSAGTHTTQAVSFTTEYDKPYDTITSIDSVTFTIGNQSQNDYTFAARVNFRIAPHSADTTDRVNTYGVCWSVLHEPSRRKSDVSNTDFKDCTPPISGADTANLRTSITQIHSNTKYYVRAYASTATAVDDTVNGVYSLNDIVYSDEASFITLPIMFTNGVTATLHNAATLSGRIGSRDSEGHLVHDPSNTNPNGLYGVCWGASANPTRGQGGATNYVEQNINTSNANTFDFNLMATGLSQNTAYHYRAYSINSEGNIAYGADTTFRTREHSVTLVANPTAGGAVSGSYANLESDHYTAVATPNVGYTFTNWTEGSSVLSTDASYSFDVTNDHTLQANFTINTYTITVAANPTGYGTVTGGGTYNYGTEVTLTATANTGYSFVNWTLNGNVVSGEDNYTITVTDNANYVANFEINNYTISATANPEEGGTVTGGGTYTYGANVTVTATANTGYTFTNWTENGTEVSTSASYTFTANSDRNLVANFGRGGTTSGPRDIYPAPAREPWDWDEEFDNRDGEPTVTTGENMAYTMSGAVMNLSVNGTVTDAGAAQLTAAGVWYSTVGPDYDATSNAGNFVQAASIPDINTAFYVSLSVETDKTYYIRAYATNNGGTSYGFGEIRNFIYENPTVTTSNLTNISATEVTAGGTVTNAGSDELTEAGIWYSTVGPDYDATNNPGTFAWVSNPALNTPYSLTLSISLSPTQSYYIRACATNNDLTYGFGEVRTLEYKNPTVTTGNLTNASSTSVTAGGTVTNAGSANLIKAGVWYSTDDPDYNATGNPGDFAWVEAPAPALNTPYSVTLSISLSPTQSYYIRACATNNNLTYGFGEARLLEYENPSVATHGLTNITATGATVSGTLIKVGSGSSVTEVGFWYSTVNDTTSQGVFVPITPVPAVGAQYSKDLDLSALNLTNNDTCYIRAYAKNNEGVKGFGNVQTFTNRSYVDYECLPSVNHNNAKNGGGIYIANGGKIRFSSGNINFNEAKDIEGIGGNGGGIYLEEGSIMHMKGNCEVNGNHTPDFNLVPASNGTDKDTIIGGGAGIYLDGKLYIGDNIDDTLGTHHLFVNRNYAMTNFTEAEYEHGDYDQLYYSRNNVFLPYPTNKENPNYFDAYNDYGAYWEHNDINQTTANDSLTRVISLLSDISNKGDNVYSSLGFSVTKGKIPVVTTSRKIDEAFSFKKSGVYSDTIEGQAINTESWMYAITDNMNSASSNASIFDDARAYIAIHARKDDDPFRFDFIYLWDCWTTPIVKYDPALYDVYGHELPERDDSHYVVDGDGLWHIKDEKGLAWFSANVNRLNGTRDQYSDDSYAELEAVLEADLDMTEYLWVPIGSVRERQTGVNTIFRDIDDTNPQNAGDNLGFRGKFNGQGHLITGLDCRYISGMLKYGLFGDLEEGAVVENTFVDASRFRTNDTEKSYHIGGIAGLMEGGSTVRASEARFVVDLARANKATSYVGGIAGQVIDTIDKPITIHSSMAMPEIKGSVRYIGGLVGQLGANCNLLNSFSNPKFPDASYQDTCKQGTTVYNIYFGGLVGENNGLVENCYSRLQGDEPVGKVNITGTLPAGVVNNYNKSIFGWLAGTNNSGANIKYCYGAKEKMEEAGITNHGAYIRVIDSDPIGHGKYSQTLRYSGKYGFKHRDHKMHKSDGTLVESDYTKYVDAKTNDTLIGGLMNALNHWVDTANKTTPTYAKWTRTMASHINDDYPVPMLIYKNDVETFNSVGSKDTIYLLYEDNINDMWAASGKNFKANDTLGSKAAMYLYDVQPGTPPADVTITGNTNVPLYIHEDIGITQPAVDAEGNAPALTARAGVTIKNARKDKNDFTADPNWHLFSSAIQDVPMGLDYHTDTTYTNGYVYHSPAGYGGQKYSQDIPNKAKHSQSVWSNRNYFDPPQTTWFQSDDKNALSYNASRNKIGYFPTNTPYGTWRPGFLPGGHTASASDGFFDLYCYSEEFYHWVNFKREGSSTWKDHWHMDADDYSDHWILEYGHDVPTSTGEGSTFIEGNEPDLLTGKGYMMALSSESMMMADGQLNTGDIYAPVTLTAVGTHSPRPWRRYDEPWRTLNLVGNPYQSYLDFVKLIADNNNKGLLYCDSYATREDISKEFIFYTEQQSKNDPELMASQYIHPHQGFFIKVKAKGNLKFTDAMRVAGTNISLGSDFRDINYPLVNLICYEPSGHRDFTTVEVNRPELGGGSKMQNLRTGYASIYAHFEDNDYQTLFTPMGVSTVPVWFETEEDGVFTLRWNTLHGDFNYLHLIDHIMGTDIDCLTTDEYIFEAKTSDYESRFRLVFDCVGMEEYEEDDLNSATFAFQMGDELVINGEGMLQMFDISGRCLMSTQTMGQQSSVSLPKTAAGLYLLRLTTDSQVKVQKMVIK